MKIRNIGINLTVSTELYQTHCCRHDKQFIYFNSGFILSCLKQRTYMFTSIITKNFAVVLKFSKKSIFCDFVLLRSTKHISQKPVLVQGIFEQSPSGVTRKNHCS